MFYTIIKLNNDLDVIRYPNSDYIDLNIIVNYLRNIISNNSLLYSNLSIKDNMGLYYTITIYYNNNFRAITFYPTNEEIQTICLCSNNNSTNCYLFKLKSSGITISEITDRTFALYYKLK